MLEYKSLQKIRTGEKGFRDLAVTCVAFANARGGVIRVGCEDKTGEPPLGQRIEVQDVNETLTRLRGLCFSVSLGCEGVLVHDNGGEYFEIRVAPTLNAIATTSDGKIYTRVGDKCEPVRSEDIQRMANEKGTYQWEMYCSRDVRLMDIPEGNLRRFADDIRASDRVKPHVKQMTDEEIAGHYNLVDGDYLTSLGILWLGSARQRGRLCYPITVQYIVYDALERKVRKVEWHDCTLNPKELLLAVEREAVELTYSYEMPDGLFRKQIRHYQPKVIRELLVNAFAHKSYVISSDVVIEIYPDRLEITSPGGLPLGVTRENILHQRHRRNPQLINIMHDLQLMEGEGSGYDLIYELNLLDSKRLPEIISEYNYTKVTQYAEIVNKGVLQLLDFVTRNYQLSQKDLIAFGLVAQHGKLLSTELSRLLQLADGERLRSYTTRLLNSGMLITRGIKKGTEFLVNPKLISSVKLNLKTSLKTIEPYRLKALILEDLRLHPGSRMKEIAERLPDVPLRDIRKMVYGLVGKGELHTRGTKTNRVYLLPV